MSPRLRPIEKLPLPGAPISGPGLITAPTRLFSEGWLSARRAHPPTCVRSRWVLVRWLISCLRSPATRERATGSSEEREKKAQRPAFEVPFPGPCRSPPGPLDRYRVHSGSPEKWRKAWSSLPSAPRKSLIREPYNGEQEEATLAYVSAFKRIFPLYSAWHL